MSIIDGLELDELYEKARRVDALEDEIEQLRLAARDWATDRKATLSEIKRLEADKAAISETASYYLHEIELLKAKNNENS